MGITHVIRGEDLLDSTHRVLAIRRALGGAEPPEYAHLPLILGPDRAKLSKRHGAVALEEFRGRGYLPEALVQLPGAARVGARGRPRGDGPPTSSSPSSTLERVTHAAAAFDHDKLDWMNGEWIRRLALAELEARALPLAEARFGDRLDRSVFREALRIGQERAVTLVSLVEQTEFLFVDDDELRDRRRLVGEGRSRTDRPRRSSTR